jgi:hypothetical protein
MRVVDAYTAASTSGSVRVCTTDRSSARSGPASSVPAAARCVGCSTTTLCAQHGEVVIMEVVIMEL